MILMPQSSELSQTGFEVRLEQLEEPLLIVARRVEHQVVQAQPT
ncbi:hypothetical protein I541_5753 [Mycobacteroides abscessus]|nr:hypothetical protein I541_5753 [Mycobacteroides abscessus]